jgi:hypothetical protein
MQTTTANGRGDSAAQYRDGQSIPLSQGWSLRFEMNMDSDEPWLQGWVVAPQGRDMASLYAARELGITTGLVEIDIPQSVMARIASPEFDPFE